MRLSHTQLVSLNRLSRTIRFSSDHDTRWRLLQNYNFMINPKTLQSRRKTRHSTSCTPRHIWFIYLVATQFLIHVFDKFLDKTKNSNKTMKTPKNAFLIYAHHFSIFNVILEEFKFSKVFWTRSTFNALILQSLIFLVESTLILLAFKNTKK
jgi:prolipoprotein diacylglyceryltransferase